LSDGGGEVDVPLFAGLTFDELDFGGETQGEDLQCLVTSLDTQSQEKSDKESEKCLGV